jgi:Beta-propeller repeat
VAKLNPEGSALVYSSMLGRGSRETGTAIAVDNSGNAYVCGMTDAFEFPVVNPIQSTNRGFVQAFVAKINPEGSALVYSTYLGGSGRDMCSAIAVGASGAVYVGGITTGIGDFPTMNAVQPQFGGGTDGWVAMIDPDGLALIYSTYLGGRDSDWVSGIVVDGGGNVYVTGTFSTGFPLMHPLLREDRTGAFLTKLSPNGSTILESTWAGFSDGGGIALDAAGSVYLAGTGGPRGLPTTPGAFQPERPGGEAGFVVKITQP